MLEGEFFQFSLLEGAQTRDVVLGGIEANDPTLSYAITELLRNLPPEEINEYTTGVAVAYKYLNRPGNPARKVTVESLQSHLDERNAFTQQAVTSQLPTETLSFMLGQLISNIDQNAAGTFNRYVTQTQRAEVARFSFLLGAYDVIGMLRMAQPQN